MDIIGLAHIGVPCVSLDGSIAFYQRLGMNLIVRKDFLNGYHTAMVACGSCVIELYESLVADKNGAGQRRDGCVDHIAIQVKNIEKAYLWCKENKLSILSNKIEETQLWAPRSCRYFIIAGPNDERLEFAQL